MLSEDDLMSQGAARGDRAKWTGALSLSHSWASANPSLVFRQTQHLEHGILRTLHSEVLDQTDMGSHKQSYALPLSTFSPKEMGRE